MTTTATATMTSLLNATKQQGKDRTVVHVEPITNTTGLVVCCVGQFPDAEYVVHAYSTDRNGGSVSLTSGHYFSNPRDAMADVIDRHWAGPCDCNQAKAVGTHVMGSIVSNCAYAD